MLNILCCRFIAMLTIIRTLTREKPFVEVTEQCCSEVTSVVTSITGLIHVCLVQ